MQIEKKVIVRVAEGLGNQIFISVEKISKLYFRRRNLFFFFKKT